MGRLCLLERWFNPRSNWMGPGSSIIYQVAVNGMTLTMWALVCFFWLMMSSEGNINLIELILCFQT